MSASYPFLIADVFTDTALAGNQLGVFVHGRDVPERLRQPLARELNFAETVFVEPPTPGVEADARARIFTPAREIPFAGHPVLGTAFVLAAERGLDGVRLETGQGVVPVVAGWMRQPPPTWTPLAEAALSPVLDALGLPPSAVVAPVEVYDVGITHIHVVVAGTDTVAALEPDLARLARVAPTLGTSVVAGSGSQWKVRMFAPGAGVPEDAATGSGAGPLSVHLARHGLAPWGAQLEISQGAEIGRPSTLFARATGAGDAVEAVEVGGSTVVVGRGEFIL